MRSVSASHPVDSCIEALERCRAACDRCSEARLPKTTLGTAALRCLRLIVQCAELCRDTAALLRRADEINAATLRNHVRSCSVACERCRREIERAGFVWAQDCLDACTDAATSCALVLPGLPLVPSRRIEALRLGRHD